MLPLLFALLFAVIEYAYYLGAIHYVNYATFVGARAIQGADLAEEATDMLLTGNTTSGVAVTPLESGVQSTLFWEASLPGIEQLLGNMDVTMSVHLGPPECRYELTSPGGAEIYSDNRLKGSRCD